MNKTTNYIKQRLSLREPLQDSLDILANISEKTALKKTPLDAEEAKEFLNKELEIIKKAYPTFSKFERNFPSIAFSIATGVGKTRLMGACISYLYLEKGIRNFFVLAPNLTIYEKLIEDFGNPGYHKYVFNGISELVHNRPIIITGDNYNQQGTLFNDEDIRINIFNIAKFNSENRGTNKGGNKLAPRIKRLSEYLGQSYWDYLSGLDDLVILMDEAHRYHADSSKNALNDLNPVLGLELTATPFDEKGNTFKNIVFEYSLAQALSDGKYVKNPAIATRKNFNKSGLSEREIEIIKLEDAVSIHLDTKNELEIYSENNGLKKVKPFILVVCRDIAHSKEIYELINSDKFYDGDYIDKVLQIDSSTKKEEDIEKQFLSLESPDNNIEVVIHVNMLKEGWDVTNLYTIVPLRAANAAVLIEQTIGRGLRLPYGGKRTGVDSIDKLTVVAHENFESVIQAAKDPNSVLNKLNFIEIPEEDLSTRTKVVSSKPKAERQLEDQQTIVNAIPDAGDKQKAQNSLDAKKIIIDALPGFSSSPEVRKIDDLSKEEVKKSVILKVKENLEKGQVNLFAADILKEADTMYDIVVKDFKNNTIEIPRMDLVQGDSEAVFENFDLDTSEFTYKALEQEIIRIGLKDNQVDTLKAKSSGSYGDPVKLIISELINYSEVDYDDNADLLYELANQAFETIQSNLSNPEDISKVVFQFKSAIAEKIFSQMKQNFRLEVSDYIEPKVLPFVKIEEWNFSALLHNGYKDYRDAVQPTNTIPKFVFRGFEKACHFEYKFDSKTEKDLAFVLESDETVIKWLRPAPNQFRIYWDNNSKKYEPDFIVETKEGIYMVETKAENQMTDNDVLQKMDAALKYCHYATKYVKEHNGKPWHYLLIPHNAVSRTVNFDFMVAQYETKMSETIV